MVAVLSFLVVLTLSLLVTRIATVALVHTGLGRETARFQARSAFSGAGFTTQESEAIVGHPVRRRIVFFLMLVGNVGIVTAVSALLLSLIDLSAGRAGVWPLLVLLGGLAILLLLASSALVDRYLGRIISWALRRFTTLDARDYAALLHVREDYGVSELRIGAGDWLDGRTLREARLSREGVLILGIECPGGEFIGAPPPDTLLRAGDRLILYGRAARVAEIDRRGIGDLGDREHAAAMEEQQQVVAEERERAGR
ncbi:MAG: TrkA C-terminal domain-containing protein [Proteobacteria bacterium]|nr:TrkA C-terminal domain-containing protein [Pseudomonadota bacterium]